MAAERYASTASTNAIIGAFESIRECLKDVKTRDLVDHMSAKKKSCFIELKERVKKLLAVVRNAGQEESGTLWKNGYRQKQSNERSFGKGNPLKWLWSCNQQRLLH